MLKYISKFAMDILPSVAATVIGAYIVNHYMTRPAADKPPAAAVSSVDPRAADIKTEPKSSDAAADAGSLPQPGVKAKGVSEKVLIEKQVAEKPPTPEKAAEKPAEKAADKPADTASIAVEPRRHLPLARDKATTRTVSATPASTAAAPVVSAPATAPPVEAATADEHRDANELARAAIERLRSMGETAPRPQESARAPEPARVVAAPAVAAPAVRPLPPPIMVSTPGAEPVDPGTTRSTYPDSGRPTPPAEIPSLPAAPPLDLRAEATAPPLRAHTSVAEGMLLAAKSVFHAVLPIGQPK